MNVNLLGLGIISLLFWGCASAKVDRQTVKVERSLKQPSVIYVRGFDTSKGVWNVDRQGAELQEFKSNARSELANMMLERMPEIASTYPAPSKAPSSGLLIDGEFTRVNQGSRALRMGIGFGAGGTKVETIVYLYDLSYSKTKPVVTFRTTGGSNAQPGLIAGGILTAPLYAGLNSTGLTADWERTSREIRNFIIEQSKAGGGFTPVSKTERSASFAQSDSTSNSSIDNYDAQKIYFYSPFDEARTNLLSAPQSDRGKTGICPITGKDFIIP